jgi:hypothetical protein
VCNPRGYRGTLKGGYLAAWFGVQELQVLVDVFAEERRAGGHARV